MKDWDIRKASEYMRSFVVYLKVRRFIVRISMHEIFLVGTKCESGERMLNVIPSFSACLNTVVG